MLETIFTDQMRQSRDSQFAMTPTVMTSHALLLKWCQTSTRLDTTLIPTQQYAKGYAYDAERKMGEMLAATDRAVGGQPYQAHPTGNVLLPVEHEPTLTELGITKRESSHAQMLAELPEETFEAVKDTST